MKEEYKDIYSRIKAPAELKSCTLAKMKESLEEESEQAPQGDKAGADGKAKKKGSIVSLGNWRSKRWVAMAAAAVIALCFLPRFLTNNGSIYVTPLKEGEFYDEVALKDGYLKFVDNDTIITPTPNAGIPGTGGNGQDPVSETFEYKNGGVITLEKRAGGYIKNGLEDQKSRVADQELYITVTNADDDPVFEAKWFREDVFYLVKGSGVTQKEFTDFVVKEIFLLNNE